jgi:hypothetical protein
MTIPTMMIRGVKRNRNDFCPMWLKPWRPLAGAHWCVPITPARYLFAPTLPLFGGDSGSQ